MLPFELQPGMFCTSCYSGGSKGAQGTRPPLGGPNSFNFMQFLGNFGKIVCWHPPPGELAPPPRGNPGSATVLIFKQKTKKKKKKLKLKELGSIGGACQECLLPVSPWIRQQGFLQEEAPIQLWICGRGRGSTRDACFLVGRMFFQFRAVFRKMAKTISLRFHLWDWHYSGKSWIRH